MNDSKNSPKPLPPDDFSATTPNIKIPKSDLPNYGNEPANDWEKTNYNYSPKDLQADEWKKPAYTTPPNQPPDYTPSQPSAGNAPKENDWGMTQANIKLPNNQPNQYEQSDRREDFGGQRQSDYGATSPSVQFSDNQRQTYQNTPPAPANIQPVAESEQKKGGIPGWAWIAGGLSAIFLFAVVVLIAVWAIFLKPTAFDLTVKNVPVGSDVRVEKSSWSVTTADGNDSLRNYRLFGLKAGESKEISIVNAAFACTPFTVTGVAGVPSVEEAKCSPKDVKPVPKTGCDPSTFSKNDIQKSHDCAYEKLNGLGENFAVQDLLDAMNLYIINFASGSYAIKPDDMKFLEKASEYMKKLPPNVQIEVGGHTDNTGKNNQKLSENRANAVKEALKKFGIKDEILLTQGYGDTRPKDTNATEDGKFRNRRIEYSARMSSK